MYKLTNENHSDILAMYGVFIENRKRFYNKLLSKYDQFLKHCDSFEQIFSTLKHIESERLYVQGLKDKVLEKLEVLCN